MPGVDLDLDLPTLDNNMAEIWAMFTTAISAIADDLADKVTPSEIDVNVALSMEGNALTNVGSAQFLSGNPPTAGGSLYYYGGEFYMIDSTAVIQVTANGSLNAGALGSIVGDYGGSNPALVSYDDATGEYRFTEDVGVWADLSADDLILHSASGSVRFAVDNAITTPRQFIIKSLPTSGVSFLVYNSATSTVEDGATTPVTAMSIATLTVTNPVKHGDYQKRVPFSFASVSSPPTGWNLSGNGTYYIPIPLEVGERIKAIKIDGVVIGGGSTVHIRRNTALSIGTTGGAFGDVINSGTLSATVTATLGTMTVDTVYLLQVVLAGGDSAYGGCLITYDRP